MLNPLACLATKRDSAASTISLAGPIATGYRTAWSQRDEAVHLAPPGCFLVPVLAVCFLLYTGCDISHQWAIPK